MSHQTPPRVELLEGTLDLLILRTLLPGRNHGHAITKHIQQTSEALLQVETGSLYPALHRLEAKGWIAASWELSDKGKRARFYRLTALGRKQLVAEQIEMGGVLPGHGIGLETRRSGGTMKPFFRRLRWLVQRVANTTSAERRFTRCLRGKRSSPPLTRSCTERKETYGSPGFATTIKSRICCAK